SSRRGRSYVHPGFAAGREDREHPLIENGFLIFVGARKLSVGDLKDHARHAALFVLVERHIGVPHRSDRDGRWLVPRQLVALPDEPSAERRELNVLLLQRPIRKEERHEFRISSRLSWPG